MSIWQDILNVLRQLLYGKECKTMAARFSNNQSFNFKTMGGGKGIRNFTIRNTGNYLIHIDDIDEVIREGETFTIITGDNRVIDEAFIIRFGDLDPDTTVNPANAVKEGVARWLIDVPCNVRIP